MKVAIIQLNATPDWRQNLEQLEKLTDEALACNPDFILTPEYTNGYGSDEALRALAEKDSAEPFMAWASEKAKESKVAILLGSLIVPVESGKLANRSYLINSEGKVQASYDKRMLFSVHVPNRLDYDESEMFEAGSGYQTTEVNGLNIGLTICYDLRQPTLYRALSQEHGANVFTIPSAFTKHTGELGHWETLLKARAIENSAYVLAPNQCGKHAEKRHSYGHSMIIDPWGHVLAEADASPGVIVAEIDHHVINDMRSRIPAWKMIP